MFEKILSKYIIDEKATIDLCVKNTKVATMQVNVYEIGICDLIFKALKIKLKLIFLKRHVSYAEERLLERMNEMVLFRIQDVD